MSHFTDNLYLRREIQRLLNENFQLKQILMEQDPNDKSAEERKKQEQTAAMSVVDALSSWKKSPVFQKIKNAPETEQRFKSAKEAAKFIEDQETKKQQQDFAGFQDPKLSTAAQELGFSTEQIKAMDASNFRRYIQQVRSKAATKEQKSAQGDRQKRADDIKKAIRDGTYRLTPGQEKTLERGGERALDRMSWGLAGQDQFQAGIRARRQFYDDTTDLNKYDRGAEGIIRRREMEGSMDDIDIGGAAEQYVRYREYDAAQIKAMREREAAAETARRQRNRFDSMSDDELLSMASQRGTSAIPGDQVRAFNAFRARPSQSEKDAMFVKQQLSQLEPGHQAKIREAMSRGLSFKQAREEIIRKNQERDEERLRKTKNTPPWTAEDEKRLNDMEAAYRARTEKAKREQSATQAIKDVLGRFQ